jgi:hypothetical protein
MFTIVFGFCLLAQQGAVSAQDRLEQDVFAWEVRHSGETATNTNRAVNREALYEEQQFVAKFNHLLDILQEFANEYNQHQLDLKKIKALKKAWHDLEKTDGWMKLAEANGH